MNLLTDSYFDRLDQCLEACIERVRTAQAQLEHTDGLHLAFCSRPVNYNETVRHDIPLCSIKGKLTRKFFHATISRTLSGRYELTSYIL